MGKFATLFESVDTLNEATNSHLKLPAEANELHKHNRLGEKEHSAKLSSEMHAKHGSEAMEHVAKAHEALTKLKTATDKMREKIHTHMDHDHSSSVTQAHYHLQDNDHEYAKNEQERSSHSLVHREHIKLAQRASFVHNHPVE